MLAHGCSLSLVLSLAAAYSFDFTSTPTQCQNVSVALTGSDGTPPFNILVLAYGDPPGGDEIRKIISHDFTERTTSFNMAWPANAQFVAMVSDSASVGSGGTSLGVTVMTSSNDSCLPKTVSPAFTFSVNIPPTEVIDECLEAPIYWTPTATNPVTLYVVIPGGESFSIDTSKASTITNANETGITWTPNVAAGTDIIIVAGDTAGRGSGGSTSTILIGSGDKACLNSNSPSSTAGAPAGEITGAAPTSTSSSKVGPIVGGVIGGLSLIIIILLVVLFYFWRRRRGQRRASVYEKPDLTDEVPGPDRNLGNGDPHLHLPQGYEPTPFIVPPSEGPTSHRGSAYELSSSSGAPTSALTPNHLAMTEQRRSAHSGRSSTDYLDDSRTTAAGSASDRDRKGGIPMLRPVNIIQHDDGGAVPESSGATGEPETVELPPTYASVRGTSPAPHA